MTLLTTVHSSFLFPSFSRPVFFFRRSHFFSFRYGRSTSFFPVWAVFLFPFTEATISYSSFVFFHLVGTKRPRSYSILPQSTDVFCFFSFPRFRPLGPSFVSRRTLIFVLGSAQTCSAWSVELKGWGGKSSLVGPFLRAPFRWPLSYVFPYCIQGHEAVVFRDHRFFRVEPKF